MKTLKYAIIYLTFSLLSCNSENEHEITTENEENTVKTDSQSNIAKDVSPDEFKNLISIGNYQLVDVRTEEEYEAGTIEDAINIDVLKENFADEISRLETTKPILVFCKSGGRSSRAMKELSESGFKEVYNLIGGYSGWPKQ
ncbi:MAG: rhodanese-like domain-containing protein [Crocinitomicaceae bacterium]